MTFEEAQRTILPGRYRHYKGNEYEVIGIARHSETLCPLVVYRALYGEGGLWVRPRRCGMNPFQTGVFCGFSGCEAVRHPAERGETNGRTVFENRDAAR